MVKVLTGYFVLTGKSCLSTVRPALSRQARGQTHRGQAGLPSATLTGTSSQEVGDAPQKGNRAKPVCFGGRLTRGSQHVDQL